MLRKKSVIMVFKAKRREHFEDEWKVNWSNAAGSTRKMTKSSVGFGDRSLWSSAILVE